MDFTNLDHSYLTELQQHYHEFVTYIDNIGFTEKDKIELLTLVRIAPTFEVLRINQYYLFSILCFLFQTIDYRKAVWFYEQSNYLRNKDIVDAYDEKINDTIEDILHKNEKKLLNKCLFDLKYKFKNSHSSINGAFFIGEISSFEELIDRIEYKCLDEDIPFMNIWIRTILIPIIYQHCFKEYLLERLMALYYIRDFGSEINTREMDNYGYPKEELSMLTIIVEAVNYNSDNDDKTDILDLTIE